MKKSTLLILIIAIGAFALFGGKLFNIDTSSPAFLLIMTGIGIGVMLLMKPRQKSGTIDTDAAMYLLGDFAKDAFADDEQLQLQFTTAVSNYMNNRPMAAAKKLEKLQPMCRSDADHYSVGLLLGMIKASSGDYDTAISLFNKAIIIHPTTELALELGSAQQRIGELEKARDSYEFALELDPKCIDARSALATAYVADGMLDEAIEEALEALELDPNHASSLATCAICYGIQDNALMSNSFLEKAVNNGYSKDKITGTIPILKKKFKM